MTDGYTRAQGVHGAGTRAYTPAEADRVVNLLRSWRDEHGVATVEALSIITGIGGRTIRQILSDRDGVDFLLAAGDDGLHIAADPAQAHGFTARLLNQASTMIERVQRREAFAAKLPPGGS